MLEQFAGGAAEGLNDEEGERIARLEEQTTWQGLVKTKKKGAAGQEEIAAGQALQAAVRRVLEATAEVCRVKGQPEPDPDLRDYENVPLNEDIDAYLACEVLPHVPDAWLDHTKTKVGYEIPFTPHFCVYEPPRPLAVIEQEIRDLEREIQGMLAEVLS